MIVAEDRRYSVGELADLGGVTRRTVRFYVQEGLIPAPLGLGRGAHYNPDHLEALLRVKDMQERGMSLDAIRGVLAGGKAVPTPAAILPWVARSHWTRLEPVPGVEIQVSSDRRVPPPKKLQELVEWCHQNFRRVGEEGEES